MNLQNVKKLVEAALERIPPTRNDDKLLIFVILFRINYPNDALDIDSSFLNIKRLDLQKFPSFESIIRARAYIQNVEKRFPPADETVRRRRERQKEFRKLSKGELF
jgi:hypothetical protein